MRSQLPEDPRLLARQRVFADRNSLTMQSLVQLIDDEIANVRISNDTAELEHVRINQGKIQALNTIKDFIHKECVVSPQK